MPVVDDGDYEIARFCDGDRGEAAERHQLFAVAGDDEGVFSVGEKRLDRFPTG